MHTFKKKTPDFTSRVRNHVSKKQENPLKNKFVGENRFLRLTRLS